MTGAQPRRRILIVAYYYPPRAIVGARRPAALAKYLARAGHEVTVLTSPLNGPPCAGEAAELRARDLLATRLNWRKAGAVGVGRTSGDVPFQTAGLWGSLFVPDVQLIAWAPFAAVAALRHARRRRPDVAITTSPVESAHLVGLALSRGAGIPWIADLRDGWRFEAPREEWPTAGQRRLDDLLERSILTAADRVVTVSEPLSRDLRRRLGLTVETIANGYDPEDLVTAADASGKPEPDRLRLVHTGGLGHERTLEPVIAALRRLRSEDAAAADRFELVVAGARTEAERILYDAADLDGLVRPLGMLPRAEALALQRSAEVLLLVTSGARTGEATGKLFEYLAARRPVLVLGDASEAARIVAETGAGWAIPVRDADSATEALRRILAGEHLAYAGGDESERFAYPALAGRYETLVEDVIARRR